MERPDLRIDALGSGSDFTPFLQHLGIASMNIGFGGEDGGGRTIRFTIRSSTYTRFGDPGFAYGVALAKVCGHAVLRLANADTLPFEFTNFADTVGTYVDRSDQAHATRCVTKPTLMNNLITNGMLKNVQDPTEIFIVPQPNAMPCRRSTFRRCRDAVADCDESANAYRNASKSGLSATENGLDEILYKPERALTTRPKGLPRRDWFRHQIYAPGFYTGYGVKTLPGIREAIEQRNWKEAARPDTRSPQRSSKRLPPRSTKRRRCFNSQF